MRPMQIKFLNITRLTFIMIQHRFTTWPFIIIVPTSFSKLVLGELPLAFLKPTGFGTFDLSSFYRGVDCFVVFEIEFLNLASDVAVNGDDRCITVVTVLTFNAFNTFH